MAKLISILAALGASAFFTGSAVAEESTQSAEPDPVQERTIAYKRPHFRFSFLGVEAIGKLCYLSFPVNPQDPPKIVPLHIGAQNLSSIYEYNGPKTLQLYWMPKDGQPPRLAASYMIADGQKRRMFLLTKTGKMQDGYPELELRHFNDDPKFAPAGSYQVINCSKIPVAGRIGEKLFKPFPAYVPPQKHIGTATLDIYVYLESQNRISNTHRSMLDLTKDYRYWLCIFPYIRANKETIVLRVIRERMTLDSAILPSLPDEPLPE